MVEVDAERLAREQRLADAEYRHAWERFRDRFGRTGRTPRSYYGVEVGHILHLAPRDLADVRPLDLLFAAELFDTKYRTED